MNEETRIHVGGGKKKSRSHHRRRFHEHMILLILKKFHESAPHLKKKISQSTRKEEKWLYVSVEIYDAHFGCVFHDVWFDDQYSIVQNMLCIYMYICICMHMCMYLYIDMYVYDV